MPEHIQRRHHDENRNPDQAHEEIFATDVENLEALRVELKVPAEIDEIRKLIRREKERFEGENEELAQAVLVKSQTSGAKEATPDTDESQPPGERGPSPEEQAQAWLGGFKTRFEALLQLHEGIEWAEVEKSLRADPESMAKLQALDAKGHQMNVFGEENDEFIFVSAWDRYEQVATDHRNIAYDTKGQRLAERQGYWPNGNAVSIIADIMGVEEDEATNYLADPKFHEQLRSVVAINGWAWLKTDVATRKTGRALYGYRIGRRGDLVYVHQSYASNRIRYGAWRGSFRAALRVKKA